MPPRLPVGAGEVVAAAAAGGLAEQAAERRHAHGPFHSHCENCGTKLDGPWCHRCGQHDFEFHRSFRHVFLEALESFFHFEGKFFRNIVTLLFRPGRLTADFNAGKRAAQMPPFRLYVFVSFLFFFLVFVGSKPNDAAINFGPGTNAGFIGNPERAADEVRAAAERRQREQAGPDSEVAPTPGGVPADLRAVIEQAEKAAAELPASPKSDLERAIEAKARLALDPANQRLLTASFLNALPKMLLLCLPLFALYTRVLFRQSGQVYLQHLVLALHFHTFIYLFLLFRDGWAFLAGLPDLGLQRWVVLAANLWLALYPFLMLRHLFRNSWPRTILKTGLLAGAYLLTLAAGFFVTAVILFLLL